MICKKSDSCTFYRTHRYKQDTKQYRFLVESYCEGSLNQRCRRSQYEAEFCEEAPETLAPNGYLIGTHKKQRIENTRKSKRYHVKNSVCLLQVIDTPKTFSAWVIDISEGGMRLELNADPQELDLRSDDRPLKILGYTLEDVPVSLDKEIIKTVWQNNKEIGCAFLESYPV